MSQNASSSLPVRETASNSRRQTLVTDAEVHEAEQHIDANVTIIQEEVNSNVQVDDGSVPQPQLLIEAISNRTSGTAGTSEIFLPLFSFGSILLLPYLGHLGSEPGR